MLPSIFAVTANVYSKEGRIFRKNKRNNGSKEAYVGKTSLPYVRLTAYNALPKTYET